MTTTAKGKVGAGSSGNSTAASTEMLRDQMVTHLRQHREELLLEWLQSVTADGGLWMGATAAEQESASARVYDTCVECLDTLDYRDAEKVAEQMAQRAVRGTITSERMLGGMLALQDVYWHSLLRRYFEEPKRIDEALKFFESVINRILVIVALAFSMQREQVISEQQVSIRDLSTPVLRAPKWAASPADHRPDRFRPGTAADRADARCHPGVPGAGRWSWTSPAWPRSTRRSRTT